MALSQHYDLRYLDPDEAVSDFPSQWDHVIDKIDTAIHDAATDPVSLSRLPNLPAGKTTSGRFADARIPTTVARTSETSALESRIAELESGPKVTGPRNINSLITNGGEVSGELGLIRAGNTVTIYATNLQMDGSGSLKFIALPNGFRPPAYIQAQWCGRGATAYYFDIYMSGSIWTGRRGAGKSHAGVITYVTNDDWPSTLPGDPA